MSRDDLCSSSDIPFKRRRSCASRFVTGTKAWRETPLPERERFDRCRQRTRGRPAPPRQQGLAGDAPLLPGGLKALPLLLPPSPARSSSGQLPAAAACCDSQSWRFSGKQHLA